MDEIRRLKASDGPEWYIWGGGELLQTLIAADLVDEFRVWSYPGGLGKGKRLFENGVPPRGLNLVESRTTTTGVLLNTYRPAGPRMDPLDHASPSQSFVEQKMRDGSLAPENPSEAELARRRKLAAEEAQG